ncbi:MAG TPA: HAD family hydrolase [Fibrobacteria bacterium]|nr:HAD family hydrolase [Fibrobacteria bacterium]
MAASIAFPGRARGRRASGRVLFALLAGVLCFRPSPAQVADPLPSWKDGGLKRSIVEFVSGTATEGGHDFVPMEARIAVFDNDGTLWPEKPVIEGMFVLERIKSKAAADPSLKEKEPFKAALAGDTAYLKEAGEEAVAKLVAESHSGMTQEEFAAEAHSFFMRASYPKPRLPLTAVAYQPMVELLAYLRSKGYETWICSGGTLEFVRTVSLSLYRIPPEQVIGSAIDLKFELRKGKAVLLREPGLATVNDKAGKPVGISRHIGLRPIFAAGNVRSGGDIAMLGYSRSGPGLSFQLLINHDDAKREFAYKEPDGASLKAARAYGWKVVSMKNDWNTVFRPGAGEERVGTKDPG